jgi:hypothetical protein
MEPDLSAMFSATWTGQRPLEWAQARTVVRAEKGGIVFSDLDGGHPICFHADLEPRAWLSPAGDWLVFLAHEELVAFDASLRLRWDYRPFGEGIFALYFRPPFLVVSTHWFDQGRIVDTVLDLESGTRLDEAYGTEPWPTWRSFIDSRLDGILKRRVPKQAVPPTRGDRE